MKPNCIIAVTGQSNSQGYGGMYDVSKTEDQPHERVMGWNAKTKEWKTANLFDETLGTYDHKIQGCQSFAFHFAKQLAKNDPTKIVGVVNYGIGGQNIKRWTQIPSQCFFRCVPNSWKQEKTVMSIKGCNDRILCNDGENSYHFSRPVNINYAWEAFTMSSIETNEAIEIDEINDMEVVIHSPLHNIYISLGSNREVKSSKIQTEETIFSIETIKTGYTYMHAFKGKHGYLCMNSIEHVDGGMFGMDVESVKLTGILSDEFGDIYNTHVQRIKDCLQDANLKKIDCICWHQGESDFNCLGTYYEHAIGLTIEQYRNETFCNHDTIFIVGNTSKENGEEDWWDTRNIQLSKLNVDNLLNTACVDTTGVDFNQNDKIHFSSKGHRQLGGLYCEKYLQMKKNS
jgi:hypothetical protein